jgi:hypothetical protein
MAKFTMAFFGILLIFVSGLFALNLSAKGKQNTPSFPGLPDDVNKIVSFSCVPCHTSTGGLMSRTKLNFSDWGQYTAAKQKARAEKMASVLKKGSMPPKEAREKRPEIIPTQDQIDIITKWAESLPEGDK